MPSLSSIGGAGVAELTFFCSRMTLVHFFSKSPTHLAFASSTSKSALSVSRFRASYVSRRPAEWR